MVMVSRGSANSCAQSLKALPVQELSLMSWHKGGIKCTCVVNLHRVVKNTLTAISMSPL
jgi:hypothetical protein